MIQRPLSSLRSIRFVPSTLVAAAMFLPSLAFAQDEMDEGADDEMGADEDEGSADSEAADVAEDEAPESKNDTSAETPIDTSNDGETQLLLGLRYRGLITPKFLINMFGVDGGRTVYVDGIGPEIGGYWGKQGDGFMVMFSPWVAFYGLEPTPFKGKNDGDDAWELIESKMKVWYLSIDAMWDHKIVDKVSFMVGGGFGIGFVAGDLIRNEAYVTGPGDGDVPDLAPCIGPGNPGSAGAQCPADGNYGVADRWPVYPWINFQVGLRYQPIDDFMARFEMGLGSAGFWFGLGADYSLFL